MCKKSYDEYGSASFFVTIRLVQDVSNWNTVPPVIKMKHSLAIFRDLFTRCQYRDLGIEDFQHCNPGSRKMLQYWKP
jgi:hypothetical protein